MTEISSALILPDQSRSDGATVALHAVTARTDKLVNSVKFIPADFHILVAVPQTAQDVDKAMDAFVGENVWVKPVYLSDDFDINIQAQELCEFFDSERILAGASMVVNLSYASRFLWQAFQIAAHHSLFRINVVSFIVFDWSNGRAQYSPDGMSWTSGSLPALDFQNGEGQGCAEFVELDALDKFDRPAKTSGSESEDAPAETPGTGKPASTVAPKKTDSPSVAPKNPDDDQALIEGDWRLPETVIESVDAAPTGKNPQEILARGKLLDCMFTYRNTLTCSRSWTHKSNGQVFMENSTFQSMAVGIQPPASLKVENRSLEQTVVLILNESMYMIGFRGQNQSASNAFELKNFSVPELRGFLGGRWFEEYVFAHVDALREKSKSISEVTLNVIFEEKKQRYEIDVLVKTKTRDFLIECKTGVVEAEDFTRLQKKATAYEKKYGKKTVGLLVSIQKLSKTGKINEAFNASPALACICGDTIPDRLKNMLTIQPGNFLS